MVSCTSFCAEELQLDDAKKVGTDSQVGNALLISFPFVRLFLFKRRGIWGKNQKSKTKVIGVEYQTFTSLQCPRYSNFPFDGFVHVRRIV